MDLKIPYRNQTSASSAYQELKKHVDDKMLEKFKITADIQYQDDQKVISANGKGFKFSLHCHHDYCEVQLELGLLLKAFKTKILSYIEHQVKKHVG